MVSNIGDSWGHTFPKNFPNFWPQPQPQGDTHYVQIGVSQAEFDALKREVEELKKLLKAAKSFDDATGQPHCEMDAKVKMIKDIAKIVGVDLGDVFESPKPTKPSP